MSLSLIKTPREHLISIFRDVFTPDPILSCREWADRYRIIPPGTSAQDGPWKTDRVPFMIEPLESVSDPSIEMLVMMCSSQVGKSELIINALCYFIAQRPTSILFVQPTLEAAEQFSKERIEPSFMACPQLSGLFEQGKDGRGSSRKSSETIRFKKFPGGNLALVGANSPAGLASRPIQVLLCDEVDRFYATKEGDPLKLAIQRTQNYYNRKIILVSTPTMEKASNIERYYKRTDRRNYFIPCPKCGNFSTWEWKMVKWDKNSEGLAILDSARIECPFCDEVLRGAGKPNIELLARGEWRDTTPYKIDKKRRGYHFNALLSPWVNLSEIVEEYNVAVATKTQLQEFWNLKLGLPFSSEFYVSEWRDVYTRRESYGETLPSKNLVLTAGVDVQRDRLEIVVLGWGKEFECFGVEYAKIKGDPKNIEIWNELDTFLSKTWMTEDGRDLTLSCVCIDSGDGVLTQEVYAFTSQRENRGIFAVKGRGGQGVPFINKPTRSNRFNAWLFVLGVNAGKSLLHSRLKILEEGAGYVHFPFEKKYGFSETFFRGLYSERLETKKIAGKDVLYWRKVRERNEGLDCCVYALAAIEIFSPDLATLDELRLGKVLGGNSFQQQQQPQRRILNKGVEI